MDNQQIIERILTEYSLLHLQHWIYTKEIAVISAYREVLENVISQTCKQALQIGHKFTPDENAKRTTLLRAALLSCYSYGVTLIGEKYIKQVGASKAAPIPEQSILVVNTDNSPYFYKVLFRLSEYFNQDYFLYKPKDTYSAYKVYTNAARYEKEGKEIIMYGEKQNAGRLYCHISDEFLARLNSKSSVLITDEFLPSNTQNLPNAQTANQIAKRTVNQTADPETDRQATLKAPPETNKIAAQTGEQKTNRIADRKRHALTKEINQEIESCMIDDMGKWHGIAGMRCIYLSAQQVINAIKKIKD